MPPIFLKLYINLKYPHNSSRNQSDHQWGQSYEPSITAFWPHRKRQEFYKDVAHREIFETCHQTHTSFGDFFFAPGNLEWFSYQLMWMICFRFPIWEMVVLKAFWQCRLQNSSSEDVIFSSWLFSSNISEFFLNGDIFCRFCRFYTIKRKPIKIQTINASWVET